MSKSEQSAYPQIDSKETPGETWWTNTYSTGGLTKLEYFYAAALTGVCMNPILCAQAIENSRSQIVGQQTDMSKALAATAYKLAQAAMQQLETESKDGF